MTDNMKIEILIAEELVKANKLHPPFHSQHEAYAVIQEELEELQEEVAECYKQLEEIWMNVRTDDSIRHQVKMLRKHAVFAAQEAIQVAAMCYKTSDSLPFED